jgi:hypothetical protein
VQNKVQTKLKKSVSFSQNLFDFKDKRDSVPDEDESINLWKRAVEVLQGYVASLQDRAGYEHAQSLRDVLAFEREFLQGKLPEVGWEAWFASQMFVLRVWLLMQQKDLLAQKVKAFYKEVKAHCQQSHQDPSDKMFQAAILRGQVALQDKDVHQSVKWLMKGFRLIQDKPVRKQVWLQQMLQLQILKNNLLQALEYAKQLDMILPNTLQLLQVLCYMQDYP